MGNNTQVESPSANLRCCAAVVGKPMEPKDMTFRFGLTAIALLMVSASFVGLAHAADTKIPAGKWVAEVAAGGSLSTGNTRRNALDFDGKAKYRLGRVEDRYKLKAELGRDKGVTTSQRWVAGTETNIDISNELYALGFANYEDNKFSGFLSEIEGGLGVGYRILQTSTMLLSINAGPGYRVSRLKRPLRDEKEIFARGTALFEYQISDNAKLSNDLSVRWDSERTKIENTFAVTSKIIGSLSGRASLDARYNTNPPGALVKKTDTITKVALVYSF